MLGSRQERQCSGKTNFSLHLKPTSTLSSRAAWREDVQGGVEVDSRASSFVIGSLHFRNHCFACYRGDQDAWAAIERAHFLGWIFESTSASAFHSNVTQIPSASPSRRLHHLSHFMANDVITAPWHHGKVKDDLPFDRGFWIHCLADRVANEMLLWIDLVQGSWAT